MNAVAADIMACVSNYERGGIEALPAPALHEQMDDPDCEMSAAEVCHIAINLASDMISEVDMVHRSCGKPTARAVQEVETVTQVVKATSKLPGIASAVTGEQPPPFTQSHSQNQSLNQISQQAVQGDQVEQAAAAGFRLPMSRGKGARRSEARSSLDQLQDSLESLTGEMWETFTRAACRLQEATTAGDEAEQLRWLSKISAMQGRSASMRALCEQSQEYKALSEKLRGDVHLQLYTMAEGEWQAAAAEAEKSAAVKIHQGSAAMIAQQLLTALPTGGNVSDQWFEDCLECPADAAADTVSENGWKE